MPEELCSKEGCANPLDRTGTPKWCKSCWAEYQREYKAATKTRGFSLGVGAFREHIVKKFQGIGADYTFTGPSAAEWVRNEPFTAPQD